ncbi:L-type lectin-domain containing receptor kinase IV.2 [Sorghum bicolor]|uniref:L-type lectin-domain containing receptor kinase IV.2 n=1 Tax=Sorghum bicolor TaxID=4558 RepID=UPI0007F1A1DA|nr:L-type lectin-domain containing receptor kinase IV.2 [Sorghum bicolor]|eukprot:XP_002451987.2 L-type lectin-domain containing receptor kinase IV.2 [Sorghum bicolor]
MIEAKRVLPLLFLYGLHLAPAFAAGDCSSDGDKFVYSSFAAASLTLDGAAMVTPRGLLQLTSETALSKGHAFHPTPLQLRAPLCGAQKKAAAAVRSFSASFVFGIVPVTPGMGGHGLALVVAPSKDLSSAMASNYIGLLNSSSNGSVHNHIVAVELDTIQSPEFHDINDNHVGVDVNSLVSVDAASAGYYDDRTGELRNLTLVSGEVMRAWVDYDGDATRIDVTLAPVGTERPKKPLVSATVDLSTVIIADVAYVGFSSSTGRLSTLHYVLGWSFAVGGPAPAIDMASLPPLPDRRNSGSRSRPSKTMTLAIALPVAVGALAIIIAMAACVLLVVRRRYRYIELREDWEIEFGAHRLPYKDLFLATDGFKDKNLLGLGGFGKVYKGVLPTSGMEVAVKRVWHESEQGMKEFVAEVATIGRLRHRNLVQLLGYCRLKDQLLLVYDYMPNGSLEKHLYSHDNNTSTVLNWAQRFQIIKGVASGLLYIHEEWEQVVIHRDVKASNVLLDSEMNARLGDFGLARLRSHDTELLHTTVVAGTFGYIAPELALTGKASPLTDVFAFGAFLLEVVTGRRPVEETIDGDRLLLVDWVFEQWRKDQSLIEVVVDPRIQGDYDVNELSLTLRVGLLCSHPLASVRPSMRTVMQYLAGDMPLPELTMPTHMGIMSMLALLQSQGFDSSVMATSSSSSSSMRSSSTLLSQKGDDKSNVHVP